MLCGLTRVGAGVEYSFLRAASCRHSTDASSSLLEVLRKGTMTRVQGRSARAYAISGQTGYFPSVTTVLNKVNKPGLQWWSVNEVLKELHTEHAGWVASGRSGEDLLHELPSLLEAARHADRRALAKAASLGTRAHDAIDALIRGEDPEVTDDSVRNVVEGFLRWRDQAGVRVICGDTKVYSATYRYAGAFDALGVDGDGAPVVLDWKTSKRAYDTHAMQIAAYAHAVEEMTEAARVPVRVASAMVVRFDKASPEFEEHRVDRLHSFNAFKAALHLWAVDNHEGCKLWEHGG